MMYAGLRRKIVGIEHEKGRSRREISNHVLQFLTIMGIIILIMNNWSSSQSVGKSTLTDILRILRSTVLQLTFTAQPHPLTSLWPPQMHGGYRSFLSTSRLK